MGDGRCAQGSVKIDNSVQSDNCLGGDTGVWVSGPASKNASLPVKVTKLHEEGVAQLDLATLDSSPRKHVWESFYF